jgi:hypothetical protein
MTRDEIFECWAPFAGPWSKWVKPVLFAALNPYGTVPQTERPALNLDWIRELNSRSALVIDVPGADGVEIGVRLAECNYQPVPQYNSAPGPGGNLNAPLSGIVPGALSPLPPTPITMVDVVPIMQALREHATKLKSLQLSPDCTPAFLLDANRRTGVGAASEGRFDNRSISFPTDFPSANFLIANGVQTVVLAQYDSRLPQQDVAHTLLRWQEAGVTILSKDLKTDAKPEPIDVPRPTYFRWLWYRMLTLFGMRRNTLGGFGGMIPVASAG